MKRGFALLCASCLIALAVTLNGCGPAIPHPIEGRGDCTSCHGQNGVKPYPQWHAERGLGNDACARCHELTVNAAR